MGWKYSDELSVELKCYNSTNTTYGWHSDGSNGWSATRQDGGLTYLPNKYWVDESNGQKHYRITLLRVKAPADLASLKTSGLIAFKIPVYNFIGGYGEGEAATYHTPSDNKTNTAIRYYPYDPSAGTTAITPIGAFNIPTTENIDLESYSHTDSSGKKLIEQAQTITRIPNYRDAKAEDFRDYIFDGGDSNNHGKYHVRYFTVNRNVDETYYDGKTKAGYLGLRFFFDDKYGDCSVAEDGYCYFAFASKHLLKVDYPKYYKAKLYYYAKTNGGTGTIKITDNGDNTCTIEANRGADGDGNQSTSATLSYSISLDGKNVKTFTKVMESSTYKVTHAFVGTQTVTASISTTFDYGPATTGTASKKILYYAAPSRPMNIMLDTSCLHGERLTLKKTPWVYNWTASYIPTTPESCNSVKGYRLTFCRAPRDPSIKNDIQYVNLVYDTDSKTISRSPIPGDGKSYIDTESTDTTVNIDPALMDVKIDDQVRLGIYAYSKDGKGDYIFSGGGTNEDFSAFRKVEDTGYVRVNTGSTTPNWVIGKVWVNTGDTWKRAEHVYAKTDKTDDSWKEAL